MASDSSSSSDSLGQLDIGPDQEWEDAEPDQEILEVVGLFDRSVFPDVQSMLAQSKSQYGFDLVAVVKALDLDFYGCIKLINYIRAQVKNSAIAHPFELKDKQVFSNDQYLQPVLEDDALLFCVDDLLDTSGEGSNDRTNDAHERANNLEEELQKLQLQFAEYRNAVGKTLDDRWTERASNDKDVPAKSKERDDDTHYFDSYAYNEIHETMLKDTTRTSAYRDFIYDHKHLFANKTVLDVGCGTGILSMFCAKAGAKRVIAVDNSDIIHKAIEIIAHNGLSDKIQCVRGKIEQVKLPLGANEKVDIIVSEWMGYCLLYEAMLDSVLWARDHYLDPENGLMVPSHCTLRIAPVADPDFVADSISFWHNVYGFDMHAMMEKIYDDVLVRSVNAENIAGSSYVFKRLPLHTIAKEELSFDGKFETILEKDIDALDGWVIWFDNFFLPSKHDTIPDEAKAEAWGKLPAEKGVAFTTGPHGIETHWRAGFLVVDRTKHVAQGAKKGTRYDGKVVYKKREENSRELEIEVNWEEAGTVESLKQMWIMR